MLGVEELTVYPLFPIFVIVQEVLDDPGIGMSFKEDHRLILRFQRIGV